MNEEPQLAAMMATDLFETHSQRYPLQYIRPRPPKLFTRPSFVSEVLMSYEVAFEDGDQESVDD